MKTITVRVRDPDLSRAMAEMRAWLDRNGYAQGGLAAITTKTCWSSPSASERMLKQTLLPHDLPVSD